ncbi:hypothetical protein [Streptomyces sp. I05A-00742]|uniref:hypothetical protein n=1 Tax=Streptomyces sp. I05A-00742 TaxID=2732853 RepID=UPI0014898022|nr:hypothetical protein [Streptomyces sp. I05A-00742]
MSEEKKLDITLPAPLDGQVPGTTPGTATAPLKPKAKQLGDTPANPDDHHAGSEPV